MLPRAAHLPFAFGAVLLLSQCDRFDHEARTVIEVPELPAQEWLQQQGWAGTPADVTDFLRSDAVLLAAAREAELSRHWKEKEKTALLPKVREHTAIRLLPEKDRHFEILFRDPDPVLAARMSQSIAEVFRQRWTAQLRELLAEQTARMEADLREQEKEVEEARTRMLEALKRAEVLKLTLPPEEED